MACFSQNHRDLCQGGEHFRLNAQNYLVPRQREPGDVYSERLSRMFYQNYIGSIVDWYTATLFSQEPILTFEGQDDAAGPLQVPCMREAFHGHHGHAV